MKKKLDSVLFVLLSAYILHEMPFLGYRFPSQIYALLIVALFLFFLSRLGVNALMAIIPVFFIPLFDIIIRLGELSFVDIGQQISMILQMMILPLFAVYVIKTNNYKLAKKIFILYLIINLITCITTYVGCVIFPNAARELAMGDATESPNYILYLNANIGGFSFIYNMCFLNIILLSIIKHTKSLYIKVLSIIYIIIIGSAVLAAEYTLAILIYVFSVIILLITRDLNVKKIINYTLFGLFLFFCIRGLMSDVLMNISENYASEQVADRLTELANILDGKESSAHSDIDSRNEAYMKSMDFFLDNPFGGWNISKSGGHSFIFDALAKYGVFGLFFVVLLIKKVNMKYIKPMRGTYIYGYALVILILFIITAMLNPKIFTNMLMFVLPIYYLLTNKTNKNNREPFSPLKEIK